MLMRESYTAQEVNEIIENIAVGISSGSGEVFFEKLVLHLWKLYKMKFIFIGLLNEKEDSVTTLKFCVDGEIADNFEYALEHTPCKKVIGQASSLYPSGVRKTFAEDLFFQKNSIESYIGIRLFDHEDKGIGLIGCLDTKEIDFPDMMKSILEIFAFRASGGLERMRTEEELERRVLKRTQELQNALDLIKEQSNTQLLESEKMASFGAMMAGFTHDLNTPIGLSITGVSYILGENKKLIQEMKRAVFLKTHCKAILKTAPRWQIRCLRVWIRQKNWCVLLNLSLSISI